MNKNNEGGFFLLGVGLTLVVLKLAGHIDMEWWRVLLPFYIFPLIILIICLVLGFVAFCIYVNAYVQNQMRSRDDE